MATKSDFLTVLRKKKVSTSSDSNLESSEELLIKLEIIDSDVLLSIVDKKGETRNPMEYESSGAMGALLKALKEINGPSPMDFSWTDTISDQTYPLRDYPFLTRYLRDCHDRIVDASLHPYFFNDEEQKVKLHVERPDKDKGLIEFSSRLMTGDREISAFLSPDYAICGDTIQAVRNVGDRFADLMAFNSSFITSMTDSFLSIFFSSSSGIGLEFDGMPVKILEKHIHRLPVLIFEKIDADNALYMRVSESLGTLPMDICENFNITKVAAVADNVVYVRPADKDILEESVGKLKESINDVISRKEAKAVWHEDNLFVLPQEIASRFLFNSLARLTETFKIMGAEKLKSYKIVAAAPKLNLHLNSGIDFLEGKASVNIAGEEFTIGDLLAQYGKNRYISLSDGNRAVVDSGYMQRLQRIFRNKKGEDVKISFFDLPETMDLLDDKEKMSPSFAVYRNFYEGFNNLKKSTLTTTGLNAKLRDYQKEGVKWLDYMYANRMGGCLADDMGLGKTVQTIALLTKTVPEAEKPTLIVMPRSLIFNWKEEFKKFAPELDIRIHYGSQRDIKESVKSKIILTSYAMVRNDIEEFLKYEFDCVILDESQSIKNIEAQTTKAVWLLKCDHRLAISGTPIENNLTELYSLFRFLNPTMFGSLKEFTDEYVAPIQRDDDADAATALRRKVFPFILRRLKKDVLSDLPERTEQVLTVEMTPAQEKLYEDRRRYFEREIRTTISESGVNKASFELLQALSELRQIASVPEEKSNGEITSPKIDLLMDYLLSAVRNGHKSVVFFNFLAGIELTAQRLEKENVGYEIMTGATRDRQKVVERFQNDDDCKVMLMTVKTGGVGLNLVAADTVFIAEPWWNKAAEEQAINRLHRIGQKNSVNCYFLITANTIEEKIRQLQEKKSALVDAVISSDSDGGKQLSAEEISFLLS